MKFIRLYAALAVLFCASEVDGQEKLFQKEGEYRMYGQDNWQKAIITLYDNGQTRISSKSSNEAITVTISEHSKMRAFLKEVAARIGQALVGASTLYVAYQVKHSFSDDNNFRYVEVLAGTGLNAFGLGLMGLKSQMQEDSNSADIVTQVIALQGAGITPGTPDTEYVKVFLPLEIRFLDKKIEQKFNSALKQINKPQTNSGTINRMRFGLVPTRNGIRAGLRYTF